MKKTNLSRKASTLVIAAIGVTVIGLLIAGFVGAWQMQFNAVGAQLKLDAKIFSDFITDRIEQKVDQLDGYLSSPWWHDAVKNANLRYTNMEPEAIQEYMTQMDQVWISAPKNSSLVQEKLSSKMSLRLKALVEHDANIADFLLTDRYGGLVAASKKTSDFYKADELWWQRAYNHGKGDTFLGEIGLDESSGKISSAIALPLKDETGHIIGIAKIAINVSEFFKTLVNYKFGKTGHIELFDQQGTIVYHPGMAPMSRPLFSTDELYRILNAEHGFTITAHKPLNEKVFSAAARVKPRLFVTNGIYWIVVVSYDRQEALEPLYWIFGTLLFLAIFIALLAILITRHVVNKRFIAPLEQIQQGAQRFSECDLDYRIDVRTSDELEELADSLNTMSVGLKGTMVSRDNLALEIEYRKKTERELKEAEEKFETLYISSGDALMLLAPPDWKFTSGNPTAIKIFHVEHEEHFTSLGPWELSPDYQPDGRPSSEKAREMIGLAMEKGTHFFEWTHKRWDGENFPATVLLTRMTVDGKDCLQATVRDISKEKESMERLKQALADAEKSRELMLSMLEDNNNIREELEMRVKARTAELEIANQRLGNTAEELKRASRAKSEFLANMSHEIRTPLSALMGFSELLDSTSLDPVQKDYVNTLRKSGEALLSLVSNILDFSKIEAGEIIFEHIDFDLEYLVNSLVKVLGMKTSEHCILFYRIAENVPPRLKGDPTRLRQILVNLVDNALKFTEKGEVEISVNLKKGPADPHDPTYELELSVRDTGIGIPVEKQAAIFNAFEQADISTTRKYGGTGLGLSISRALVRMMGGKITVASEPGKGSIFSFILKFEKAPPLIEKNIVPLPEGQLRNRTVLVVDDHEKMRQLHRIYCESAEMIVIYSASSAEEAFDWLSRARELPDVILANITLQGMNGFEMASRIKQEKRYEKIKLIAITGKTAPGTASAGRQAGFDGYLPKPVLKKDLLTLIRTVLGDDREKRHDDPILTRHTARELACKGLKVLIAEDNAVSQKLLVIILQQIGCEIDLASNGIEAVEKARTRPYDLVLMDLQMPSMGGCEATRIIRNEVSKTLPIIALTAAALKEDQEASIAAGMNDFLTKPIEADKLKEKIILWGKKETL